MAKLLLTTQNAEKLLGGRVGGSLASMAAVAWDAAWLGAEVDLPGVSRRAASRTSGVEGSRSDEFATSRGDVEGVPSAGSLRLTSLVFRRRKTVNLGSDTARTLG